MRKELKRCNYLGNISSLHYLISVSIVEHPTNVTAVKSICALNSKLMLNTQAAIYFLEELGLITIDASNNILSSEFGKSFCGCNETQFIEKLASATYLYLIENGMIDLEAVTYDPITKLCHIRKSGFPFASAVFRNLLIDIQALVETTAGQYQVSEQYEMLFETSIRKQMPKLTLEDLMEKQKRQEEQGRLAEEFVVGFEKGRLLWCPLADGVKQISDLDVTAGYDVLSYDDAEASQYNRFIEVKSFHNRAQFFWSANEYETAQKLGSRYHLYLVDMDKYLKPGYQPIIISNPASIFESQEDWIIETASWKITKI